MTWTEVLLVMLGGALGSLMRYGVGLQCALWFGSGFPVGTLIINILGSLLLGVLLFGPFAHQAEARLFLGTGFCGGFTTFSTFSVETLTLIRQENYGLALIYMAGSLAGGLFGAWAGFILSRIN